MRKGFLEPAPRNKKKNDAQLQAERANRVAELQDKLDRLQDQIDALESEVSELPAVNLAGLVVRTKAFGDAIIDKQNGEYITINAGGKEREFVLPFCVTDGFLILDDTMVLERFQKEAGLLKKIQQLNAEQRSINHELQKY